MMRKMLALTAIAFFITFPVCAQDQGKALDIKEIQTESGITAWLVEDPSLPIIAFNFAFKGIGAAQDPPDKQGLAQLASNTMDEGAGELDSEAFQKELQDLSISLRFSSGRDNFGGGVKTLTKNSKRAFELLKLALNEPRFDEEPLTRMKNANLARIRSSLSDPAWIAARLLNDKAFSGHPYARNSGGTLSSLEAITADDLRAFTKNLSKDRLHVSAAGDITEDELKAIIDNVFKDLPETSDLPAIANLEQSHTGQTFTYEMDIPQTIVEILQPGIDRTDPDYYTAQVMNYILGGGGFGSRLMEEIREKRGLTYGIYSSFMDLDHYDGLNVSTSTKNESTKALLELTETEFEKMKTAPVSEQELKSAKSYLIGALPLSLTSTDAISGLLLSLQMSDLPITYLDDREDDIQATTIEDIQTLANKLLTPDQFTTILVGKPQGIENAIKIESLPNVE